MSPSIQLRILFLLVVYLCVNRTLGAVAEDHESVKKFLEEETNRSGELPQDDLKVELARFNNHKRDETVEDVRGTEENKMGIIIVPNLPEETVKVENQRMLSFPHRETLESKMFIYVTDSKNGTNDFEDISKNKSTTESNIEEDVANNEVVNNHKFFINNETTMTMQINLEAQDKPFKLNDTVFSESSSQNRNFSFINHTLKIIRENCTSKKLSNIGDEVVNRGFEKNQGEKIRKVRAEEDNNRPTQQMQRRTFDLLGMLAFGEDKHESVVKITKEIPVPVPYHVEKKIPVPFRVEVDRPIPVEVPKPYPVTFEKKVYFPVKEVIHSPYPIFKKVPYMIKVSVDKPIPVHIAKPYPVYIEKKVPYPVERHIPFPVKIPVDRPIPVHIPVMKNIYFPVEKKIHYPVPVKVEKPVPVVVERPYPFYVEREVPVPVEEQMHHPKNVEMQNHYGFSTPSMHIGNEQGSDAIVEESKTNGFPEQTSGSLFQQSETNFHGFVPTINSDNGSQDYVKIQKKNDEEIAPQESREVEVLETSSITSVSVEQKKVKELKDFDSRPVTTIKPEIEFGKKI